MAVYAFQATCDHTETCPSGGANPEDTVFDVRDADIPTGRPGTVRQVVVCPVCACAYAVKIAASGRGYEQVDVAAPRVDSLSVGSGPIAGGASVTVSGHRLNTSGVKVEFGGVEATGVSNQSDGSLDCTTPAGVVMLYPVSVRTKVALSGVSGTFQEPENLEVYRGEAWIVVGEIVSVGADYVTVVLGIPPISGESLRGAASGATASAAADAPVTFADGEVVTGQTSGETATVVSGLSVSGVDTGFSGGEWVVGGTSGFAVQLDAVSPTLLTVDVSVENVNGQGNQMMAGFDYTI